MRSVLITCIALTSLVACTHTSKPSSANSTAISTLKPVDLSENPGLIKSKLEQYKVGGFNVGSWVNQKPGQYFKLIQPQNQNAAVIYLYRPDSKWNRQEIIAPSFFLNGKRIPSLISNHHYWIELAEGDYQLRISRPLAVVYFQKPLQVNFSVKAGEQYFIKYEEEQFRGGPNGGDADLLRVGPIMQMPTRQALKEIGMTQLKSPGLNYVGQLSRNGQIIKGKEKIKVDYHPDQDLHLKEPFKLYDPRTW